LLLIYSSKETLLHAEFSLQKWEKKQTGIEKEEGIERRAGKERMQVTE
jgi:hypothetical protein